MPTNPLPEWVLQQRRAVGRRVRHHREERWLTQEQLAELSGLSRHTIYRIELGSYRVSVDHLALIAHALDVRLVEFFT